MQPTMYWALCYYCNSKVLLDTIKVIRGIFVCCSECKDNGVDESED